jgi:hypothetical protein
VMHLDNMYSMMIQNPEAQRCAQVNNIYRTTNTADTSGFPKKMQENLSELDAFYNNFDAGLPPSIDIICKQSRSSNSSESESHSSHSRHRVKEGDYRLNGSNDRRTSERPVAARRSPKQGKSSGKLSEAMDNLKEIYDHMHCVEVHSSRDMVTDDPTDWMRNMIDSDVGDPLEERHSSDLSNTMNLRGMNQNIQLSKNTNFQLDYDSDCSTTPSYGNKYDLPVEEFGYLYSRSCSDVDNIPQLEALSHVPSALQITVFESEDAIEMDSSTIPSVSLSIIDTSPDTLYINEEPEGHVLKRNDNSAPFVSPQNRSSTHSSHDRQEKGRSVLTTKNFYDCLADEWSVEPYQSNETDDTYEYKIGLTAAPCLSTETKHQGYVAFDSLELAEGLGIELSDLLSHIIKEEVVTAEHMEHDQCCIADEVDSNENETDIESCEAKHLRFDIDSSLICQDMQTGDAASPILIQNTPFLTQEGQKIAHSQDEKYLEDNARTENETLGTLETPSEITPTAPIPADEDTVSMNALAISSWDSATENKFRSMTNRENIIDVADEAKASSLDNSAVCSNEQQNFAALKSFWGQQTRKQSKPKL